ncbi:hypothetical protein BHE74_00048828 [Ensete ventricosum]|nr:hypothetical protein BHE74_00048828 [Ensete ventricosum]
MTETMVVVLKERQRRSRGWRHLLCLVRSGHAAVAGPIVGNCAVAGKQPEQQGLAATVAAAYVGEMGKTAEGSTVGSNGRPCRGGVGEGRRQRQWLTRALDATVIVRVGNQWLYAGGATAEEGQRGPVGWSC